MAGRLVGWPVGTHLCLHLDNGEREASSLKESAQPKDARDNEGSLDQLGGRCIVVDGVEGGAAARWRGGAVARWRGDHPGAGW